MGKKTPYIGPQNQPVGGILRVPGLGAGHLTEPAGLGAGQSSQGIKLALESTSLVPGLGAKKWTY